MTARRVREYVSPGALAGLELALGNIDEALAELDRGVAERATSMLMLAVDPAFAGLRLDPRFGSLLSRIGLPRVRLAGEVSS